MSESDQVFWHTCLCQGGKCSTIYYAWIGIHNQFQHPTGGLPWAGHVASRIIAKHVTSEIWSAWCRTHVGETRYRRKNGQQTATTLNRVLSFWLIVTLIIIIGMWVDWGNRWQPLLLASSLGKVSMHAMPICPNAGCKRRTEGHMTTKFMKHPGEMCFSPRHPKKNILRWIRSLNFWYLLIFFLVWSSESSGTSSSYWPTVSDPVTEENGWNRAGWITHMATQLQDGCLFP